MTVGSWKLAMAITSIRCTSIGNKYQSLLHSSTAIISNRWINISPQLQQMKFNANEQKIWRTITITSIGLILCWIYEMQVGREKKMSFSPAFVFKRKYSTNCVWNIKSAGHVLRRAHVKNPRAEISKIWLNSSKHLQREMTLVNAEVTALICCT